MKNFKFLLLSACIALAACTSQKQPEQQISDKGTKWNWDKGTIVVETPERPAGQTSALGLALPKMEV
ncbi:MAG: glycosyl hydrolase, partial [Bacteroides sp.]|nr:glycosyl hydrolase [Bacteroides sp.]